MPKRENNCFVDEDLSNFKINSIDLVSIAIAWYNCTMQVLFDVTHIVICCLELFSAYLLSSSIHVLTVVVLVALWIVPTKLDILFFNDVMHYFQISFWYTGTISLFTMFIVMANLSFWKYYRPVRIQSITNRALRLKTVWRLLYSLIIRA